MNEPIIGSIADVDFEGFAKAHADECLAVTKVRGEKIMPAEEAKVQRLTPEEAKQAIEADKQERVKACHDEIQAALVKYRCAVDIEVLLKEGQIIPRLILNAQD